MTPEGKVKAKLNRRLKLLGNHVWKFMPVPGGFGMQSVDYLLCVFGTFVAIETKAGPKKLLTLRQIQTFTDIQAAGGLTFMVYDDDTMDACIGALVVLIGGKK